MVINIIWSLTTSNIFFGSLEALKTVINLVCDEIKVQVKNLVVLEHLMNWMRQYILKLCATIPKKISALLVLWVLRYGVRQTIYITLLNKHYICAIDCWKFQKINSSSTWHKNINISTSVSSIMFIF